MWHQFPVMPPPQQPVQNPTVGITVVYFCPIRNDPNNLMVFEYLISATAKSVKPKWDVLNSNPGNSILPVPIDPLTAIRLGLATPLELGLDETNVAYLKLVNML